MWLHRPARIHIIFISSYAMRTRALGYAKLERERIALAWVELLLLCEKVECDVEKGNIVTVVTVAGIVARARGGT